MVDLFEDLLLVLHVLNLLQSDHVFDHENLQRVVNPDSFSRTAMTRPKLPVPAKIQEVRELAVRKPTYTSFLVRRFPHSLFS